MSFRGQSQRNAGPINMAKGDDFSRPSYVKPAAFGGGNQPNQGYGRGVQYQEFGNRQQQNGQNTRPPAPKPKRRKMSKARMKWAFGNSGPGKSIIVREAPDCFIWHGTDDDKPKVDEQAQAVQPEKLAPIAEEKVDQQLANPVDSAKPKESRVTKVALHSDDALTVKLEIVNGQHYLIVSSNGSLHVENESIQ